MSAPHVAGVLALLIGENIQAGIGDFSPVELQAWQQKGSSISPTMPTHHKRTDCSRKQSIRDTSAV
jgi:hypothetical protein